MSTETTIQIKVKLFGHFRNGRFKESVQSHPEGICVSACLSALSIADVFSGIVLVNGRPATLDFVLCDGDTFTLFPLVSGG